MTASHDGWERVTFGDALNMATGIGEHWPHRREPNHALCRRIHATKLGQWLTGPDGQGQTGRQRFPLASTRGGLGKSCAITASAHLCPSRGDGQFPQAPGGPARPAVGHGRGRGLPAARDCPCAHAAYPGSGWAGAAFRTCCYGLYPTIDDVAKLTTLLQHGGQHQGQQLLSAAKLAEALYQTDGQGLAQRPGRTGSARAGTTCRSGRCPIAPPPGASSRSPICSGRGAISWCCCPTASRPFGSPMGTTYDVDTMVLAGEALRPFPCPAGSGGAPAARAPAHSRRAPCVPRCPGTPSMGRLVTIFPAVLWRAPHHVCGGRRRAVRHDSTGEPQGGTTDDVGRWHITPDGAVVPHMARVG